MSIRSKGWRGATALALLAAAPFASRAADLSSLLPRAFQKNPKIGFNVITEFTAEGAKLAPANPGHPAFYLLNDEGYSGAGDAVGGERPPTFRALGAALVKALAVNGYHAGDRARPPTLLVSCRYGYFNEFALSLVPPLPNSDGSIPPPEPGNADFDDTQLVNLVQRAAIVGGDRFAVEFARALGRHLLDPFRADPKNNELVNMIMVNEGGDLYYVIASVYDLASAQHGQKKLLWRTKISTVSQGLVMDETLPALVADSAPYFGRNMTEAAHIETRLYEGHVEIGTPTVKP